MVIPNIEMKFNNFWIFWKMCEIFDLSSAHACRKIVLIYCHFYSLFVYYHHYCLNCYLKDTLQIFGHLCQLSKMTCMHAILLCGILSLICDKTHNTHISLAISYQQTHLQNFSKSLNRCHIFLNFVTLFGNHLWSMLTCKSQNNSEKKWTTLCTCHKLCINALPEIVVIVLSM